MADRSISVSLIARMQGFTSGMKQARESLRDFDSGLERARKTSSGAFRDISVGAGGAGIALAGLAAWAVKASIDFDKQMSEVKSVSGATESELGSLRQAALQAGRDTVFSATEAAQAQAELAKAGLSTADILGGALDGALALAAAGSLDLAEAADIAAKTMNVFKLEAKDVPHIADMLAGAANATATDVHEMGEALRMGGLAAQAAGMTMDQTVVTLGAFADNALVGSDAGTSLKTMLQMLAAPTEKSATLMKQLGLETYDANGNFVGAEKLAGNLQKTLGGLTQQERNAALATLFGADAMRAANILYSLGEEGVKSYAIGINAQANAAKTAAEKTDNLAGDIQTLQGTLESLAIEAGSGANGGLRFLAQALESLVSWFSGLPGPVQTAVVAVAGLSGVATVSTLGLLKMRGALNDAKDALSSMGGVGPKLAGFVGFMGKLGAWGLGLGVLAAGLGLAGQGLDKILDHSKDIKPTTVDIEKLAEALRVLGESGKITGELANKYGPDLDKFISAINAYKITSGNVPKMANLGPAYSPQMAESFARMNADTESQINLIKGLDTALAELTKSGGEGANLARIAFADLLNRVRAGGGDVGALKSQMTEYNKVLGENSAVSTGAAQGFATAAANAETMSESWQSAIDKGSTLVQLFEQLNGKTLNMSEATIAAEASVDKLNETLDKQLPALTKNREALDLTQPSARAVRTELNNLARDGAKAAEAKRLETGSVEEGNKVWAAYVREADKAIGRMGLSKKGAQALKDELFKMPDIVTTKVVVSAETPGLAKLREMRQILASLPGLAGLAGSALKIYNAAALVKVGSGESKAVPSGRKGMSRERAVGGPLNVGQGSWVGENGPEYITATRQLFVNPVATTAGGVSGGSLRIVIEGTGVLSGLRKEIDHLGGNVQVALGPSR